MEYKEIIEGMLKKAVYGYIFFIVALVLVMFILAELISFYFMVAWIYFGWMLYTIDLIRNDDDEVLEV